jgi:hypothetical protein
MSFTAQALFDLLPAIHRIRDVELALAAPMLSPAEAVELAALEVAAPSPADQRRLRYLRDKRDAGPLRSLLAVVAEQIAAIEENLDQLYDDQFIETCADWVTPYIGDLIGYRSLRGEVPAVASPRAEVANTVRLRRRKGTAAMLEQLARDVTGWPARVSELFERLGWTQYMNHVRPEAHYAPDLRRSQDLLWIGTPFEKAAHTVDVRSVRKAGAPRYNIPNIALFLWRLRAFPLTRSPAPADPLDASGRLLRFNPLGTDAPLFTRPQTEREVTHLAEPLNVPLPIDLRWMASHAGDYYGPGLSVFLELAPANPGDEPEPIAAARISVCDLGDVTDSGGTVTGWAHVPPAGSTRVAIDPERGRIAFGDPPARPVLATFHYGFAIAIGGGEYERPASGELPEPIRQVFDGTPLQPELDAVQDGGTVEIGDSGRYDDTLTIRVNAGRSVVLRAANGSRPLLSTTADVVLDLGADAAVEIDGLVIRGGAVRLDAAADSGTRTVRLRHCTLVPSPAPSVVVSHPFAVLDVATSITGPLHASDGAMVEIRDCIVDATAHTGIACRGPAGDLAPGGEVAIENSTVIGKIHATQLSVSNSLLVAALASSGETWKAPVWADRRQIGCMRFSWIPPRSRTPRRYQCQPPEDAPDVRPHFASLRFGDPSYCQLRMATPEAIRRGASDESEMGVLHGLYQPQRESNLRVRLDEYLRFGLEAAIVYAT